MFAWVGKRPGERKFRVIKTSTVGPEKQQKWRGGKKREQMGVDYLRILPPSLSAHSDSSFADTPWLSRRSCRSLIPRKL